MSGRLGAVLLVASLAALTGCGSTVAASGGGTSGTPSVTAVPVPAPSGPSTGLTAIQGRVTGLPAGRRATVHLEIWPLEDDTEVGEAVDMASTPEVTTDAEGRWSVTLDPADLDRKHFSRQRSYVNVDVSVRAGDVGTVWGVPLWFLAADGVWRSDQYATVDDRVVDVAMDLGAGTLTATSSVGERQTQDLLVLPFTPRPD